MVVVISFSSSDDETTTSASTCASPEMATLVNLDIGAATSYSPSASATRQGTRPDGYYTAFRMNPRSTAAHLPPPHLPGLDPRWSSLVTTIDVNGVERTWHVLDTGLTTGPDNSDNPVRGTVLCVHGNPNWSYMWRGLAKRLTGWRVIAVDALNMGFSERTGQPRRLADHVADLGSVTHALQVKGPVITVAHDWGGPISMGWAQQHVDQMAGVVLMNTGVARPAAAKVPALISIARATLRVTCELTPTFLHGALRMARPQMSRDVYRGYASPYDSAARRTGIRDFVEDIPIEDTHPSFDSLASVADGLAKLQHLPALLLWGSKDIVFSDMFLHDLMERLPQADVHRYPDAGHQIMEDTDAVDVIHTWLTQHHDEAAAPPAPAPQRSRIWSAIESRRGDDADAILEMSAKDSGTVARRVSFDELDSRVHAMVRGLAAAGINNGDRLATLVTPGIDLTVLVYACLRAGIIVVAPDAALGLGGLRRALRSSRPDYVVGDRRGLLLVKALRLPATRWSVNDLMQGDQHAPLPPEPSLTDTAAIVFTSGSTGPSKGVVYTHAQLEAQRDAVRDAFELTRDDKLVVAFAPFSVLAPALGIPSVVPTMNVTKPSKLVAQTLADAARAIDATIVFASPAVVATIAATAPDLDTVGRSALQQIRSVATAGAPVSPQLLVAAQPVFPAAHIFTPYGMTEVMPVTMASAREIGAREIGAGEIGADATNPGSTGVCVGQPLPGVDVVICPVSAPTGTMPAPVDADQLGEVWVRAAHASTGYDHLWFQQHHAFVGGWHRTGDVGHLDTHGRLWIEGRVDHLIHSSSGTVAPVQTELQAETVPGVDHAAAVGIGPIGTQQLAVVITGASMKSGSSAVVADPTITGAIRAAVTADVAAVLVAPRMPVDRRHNSKIDRTKVQQWADAVLRGARPPRL